MVRLIGRALSRRLRTYYLGPDHPAKIRLWGMLRRAMGYARLTVPYAERGWISLDERCFLQGQVLATGTYEAEVWERLAPHAVGEDVVWDVGAHIGTFAIRALLHPLVRQVHCFEPDSETAAILESNLALNTVSHATYAVHRAALGDRTGARLLHRGPPANTGLTTLRDDLGYGSSTVPCLTVDDALARGIAPPPTLLKLDVEDWELRVLSGAARLLAAAPPRAIAFEAAVDRTGGALDPQLPALLQSHGYRVERIPRPSGIIDVRENFLAVAGHRVRP